MKVRSKIILLFLGLLMTFSCEKWMDLIPPTGLVREEFWKTKEDVEAVLMGAYETFGQMDDKLWLYGEMRGDMVIGDYSQDWNQRQIQEGDIYSTNGLCNWQDFYTVIDYCNEVLHNAPLVQDEDDTFTDFLLQGYLAEAYWLRGLSYFYLVRIFKDVPYVTIPTESDDTELYVPKVDGDSILSFVIADLEEYRKYITIDGYRSEEENTGRATKAAYDALLADINLWLFNYDEVIKYCENIEANDKYELTKHIFDNFARGEDSFEIIFQFLFDMEKGQNNGLYDLTYDNGHKYDPSQTAIELFGREYNIVSDDRGQDASIRMLGEDNFIIWKYVGFAPDGETSRPGTIQKSANFIVYRLADIYLMKAEAYAQLGMLDQAYDYIKFVRERSNYNGTKPPATINSYEDAILLERTKELAFEGKRWFDLMRMGRRNDYDRKGKLIEYVVTNVPSTQKRVLASKLNNPLSWYLPIYEYELERNQELVQNPFYKD